MYVIVKPGNDIYHHGIKGQKWGIITKRETLNNKSSNRGYKTHFKENRSKHLKLKNEELRNRIESALTRHINEHIRDHDMTMLRNQMDLQVQSQNEQLNNMQLNDMQLMQLNNMQLINF